MAIDAEITVRLAEVDVTDDYMVTLKQRKKDTAYTPDEAEALAKELADAAMHARLVLAEDEAARVTLAHGFDRDVTAQDLPICKDCAEGKHGACIGSAFVENGPDLDEVECRCTKAGHRGRS